MLRLTTLFVLPIVFALLSPCAAALPDHTLWKATASSGDDPALAPELAIDGDLSTRWSSDFSDPQQLTIDLGDEATVSGVCIHWETAFAVRV